MRKKENELVSGTKQNKDCLAIKAVEMVCKYCDERKDDCSDCIFLQESICGLGNMPAMSESAIDKFKLSYARKYVFNDKG